MVDMLVIGIAGKKRSGKDTLADFAMRRLSDEGINTAKHHFADALKEECSIMLTEQFGYMSDRRTCERAAMFLEEMNADETKEKYRPLLQFWGTEFKRGMVKDSYWIDKMREILIKDEAIGIDVVFIPDMRFPNEADMVKELGGYIVRIQRPGLEDGDGHASEQALNNYQGWDSEILNDTNLTVLDYKTGILLGTIAWLDRAK